MSALVIAIPNLQWTLYGLEKSLHGTLPHGRPPLLFPACLVKHPRLAISSAVYRSFPILYILCLSEAPMLNSLSPWPPGEDQHPSGHFTKYHLMHLLRTRDSAHEAERSLTQFIMQLAVDGNAYRTASILSVTLAQWTALRCHQYRCQRLSVTFKDYLKETTDGISQCNPEKSDRVASQLVQDESATERLSSQQLRREIGFARDHLERCGELLQEEEWTQVRSCLIRFSICRLESILEWCQLQMVFLRN